MDGIRRVISEADDVGGFADETTMNLDDDGDQHMPEISSSNNNDHSSHQNSYQNQSLEDTPAFVEDVPVAEIQGEQIYHSSSSLSGDEDEDDEPLVVPVVRRRNSRASSNDASHDAANTGSHTSSRDWGWFEDVHESKKNVVVVEKKEIADNSDTAMAVTAPNYVLEESLSSQKLWKYSAGQRPPQPVEERAFYEKMWAQNFARSQVDYRMPVEVLTATSPISLNPFADGSNFEGNADSTFVTSGVPQEEGGVAEAALVHRMNEDPAQNYRALNRQVTGPDGEENLMVLTRGDNVFGTTVSKSFARSNEQGDPTAGVDTINISIASYRVVESKKHGKFAQFLVIFREGGIRDTIGLWKRYSDFEELAHKVTQAHDGCAAAFANISPLSISEEPETEHLPNAITSWRLLQKRKRWCRCLDSGYLSLKVFLLERFLHDILFESSSPELLRDFVGVDSALF